jgi:hypothetical protein
MNSQEFALLLKNPEKLGPSTQESLKELTVKYPWCSSVQVLYALNLFRDEDADYPVRLRIAASHALSRSRLKRLLEETGERNDEGIIIQADEQADRPVEVIHEQADERTGEPEEVRSEQADTPKGEPEVEQEPLIREMNEKARENLLEIVRKRLAEIEAEKQGLLKEKDAEVLPPQPAAEPVKGKGLSKEQIIERFMREEPRISPPKAAFFSPSELAIKSNLDDDDLVSETLAQLCVEQGNRQRAISIYERLCLLIPEKSVYFAAQIEKLKNPD